MVILVFYKLLLSLSSVLLINFFFKRLALALIVGTVLFSFLLGYSIDQFLLLAVNAVTSLQSLYLFLAIACVIFFSQMLNGSTLNRTILDEIRGLVPGKVGVAMMPAMIGLLPMPGGALFSAPLIDEYDINRSLSPVLKNRINFWFRHIMEFCWPLFPSLLLASSIWEIAIGRAFLILFPIFLGAALGGFLFILRGVDFKHPPRKSSLLKLIDGLSPLLILIMGVFLVKGIIVESGNFYLPIIIAAPVGLLYLHIRENFRWEEWKRCLWNPTLLKMIFIVATIRVYGSLIEMETPAGDLPVAVLRMELEALGTPPLFLVALLPFICGLCMGISIGFVGASFPFLLGVISAFDGGVEPYFVIAYTSGVLGVLLSPVHVCQIVTCEYYKIPLGRTIISYIGPASVTAIAGLLAAFILGLRL